MKAETPEIYIAQLPEERKRAMSQLRKTIADHLPAGFGEGMSYGMIAYFVPHSVYPPGYHCDPAQPLPFISIASQKSHIALYHMGLYADAGLLQWFTEAYPSHAKTKPDMGKSCIRFKKPELIPFALIGELCTKMVPERWIEVYESTLRK